MLTLDSSSLRFLALADIQGNLNSIKSLFDEEVKKQNKIDFVIHTGNFGFWNESTINSYDDLSYLKQIVAFLEVLDKEEVDELNEMSTLNFDSSSPGDELDTFRDKLRSSKNSISQLDLYISGEYTLPCPVYTVFGPLDDPEIVSQIQSGAIKIPNLYLIHHSAHYIIESPLNTLPNIKLYGLGGNLKIHSLFDHGNLRSGLAGKVGDLWISITQIAEFYLDFMRSNRKDTINIFMSHCPVIKTPLLEHLAILTNADFTVSQGLHFRYPVMNNGMSFVDNMGGSSGYIENYRSRFSRLRMIMGEYWLAVKSDINELLLETDEDDRISLLKLMELGLSLFDKIPIHMSDTNERIIPLTLKDSANDDFKTSKKIIKKINDYYFSAYYNLWHFNLCDHIVSSVEKNFNIMIFKLNEFGNLKLDYCTTQGFNFNFKLEESSKDCHVTGGLAEGEGRILSQMIESPRKGPRRDTVSRIYDISASLEEEGSISTDFETSMDSDSNGYDYSNENIESDHRKKEIHLHKQSRRGRGRGGSRGRGRVLRGRPRGRARS